MTLQNTAAQIPDQPYKGLTPYSESDTMLFFGRDAERQIIAANLRAVPLTLLYGPSGVGKSSVLRAGVVHDLQQLGLQDLKYYDHPRFCVAVLDSWSGDPVTELLKKIRASIIQALPKSELPPAQETGGLHKAIKLYLDQFQGGLLIILDQFEEYFLYHADKEREKAFATGFPVIINDVELPVHFLVSIREDALARMDYFKGSIPGVFKNCLRLAHLDHKGARDAIIKPLAAYSELRGESGDPFSAEPDLVEELIKQVGVGKVAFDQQGPAQMSAQKKEPTQVETIFLQLVMSRLWNEEQSAGSRILRKATLQRLENAVQIVGTHLDSVMDKFPPEESDIAARLFYYLVTRSGTKIAYSVSDLEEYTQVPAADLEPLLRGLSQSSVSILRPVTIAGVTRYEVLHDLLAPPILEWRKRYLQARERKKLKSDRLLQHVPIGTKAVTYTDPNEWHGTWVNTRGRHTLQLPPGFRMGQYLVTNEIYLEFVKDNGYVNDRYWNGLPLRSRAEMVCRDGRALGPANWPTAQGPDREKEQHPVAGVCFHEACAFCQWLNVRQPQPEGRWTIPTEDMWEYAARGPNANMYPWGQQFRIGCCNSKETGLNTTTDVDRFPNGRSADGCYDMAGNVWEFVLANGTGANDCVLRGGSYRNNQGQVRSYLRLFGVPSLHRAPDFGFRLALL